MPTYFPSSAFIKRPSSSLFAAGAGVALTCLRGFLILIGVAICFQASAEIIVDSFEDPASISHGDPEVVTDNVGELDAARILSTDGGTFSDVVVGGMEIDGDLNLTIDSVAERPNAAHLILFYTIRYEFPITDFTEAGINDAVLLDFSTLQGDQLPAQIRVWGRQPGGIGYSAVSDFPVTASPFTLVFPFDSFDGRGGVPEEGFTQIDLVSVQFWFPSNRGEFNFQARLDAIRVGVIPEPVSLSCFVVSALCLAGRREHRQ